MTKQDQTTNTASEKEDKSPDYIVRQYRYIRTADGVRTRKETIGVAWANASNGSICLRPNGRQIIDNDIYLFPNESRDAE